jgi:hypothetical protein
VQPDTDLEMHPMALTNTRKSIWLAAGVAAIALGACGEKPAPAPAPAPAPEVAAAPVIPTIAPDPAQGDGGLIDFYNPGGPAPADSRSCRCGQDHPG